MIHERLYWPAIRNIEMTRRTRIPYFVSAEFDLIRRRRGRPLKDAHKTLSGISWDFLIDINIDALHKSRLPYAVELLIPCACFGVRSTDDELYGRHYQGTSIEWRLDAIICVPQALAEAVEQLAAEDVTQILDDPARRLVASAQISAVPASKSGSVPYDYNFYAPFRPSVDASLFLPG